MKTIMKQMVLITVVVGTYNFLTLFNPYSVPIKSSAVIAEDMSDPDHLEKILEVLTGVSNVSAKVDDFDSRVNDRLSAIEEKLSLLTEALEASSSSPIINPPQETEPTPKLEIITPEAESPLKSVKSDPPAISTVKSPSPASSRVQNILNNYRGQDWVVRGQDTRSHLISDHGFSSQELSGLSEAQLRKLHGAAHTNHWSYSNSAPSSLSPAPSFSSSVSPSPPRYYSTPSTTIRGPVEYYTIPSTGQRVQSSWQTHYPSTPRFYSSPPVNFSRPVRQTRIQNCPNGFCPLR